MGPVLLFTVTIAIVHYLIAECHRADAPVLKSFANGDIIKIIASGGGDAGYAAADADAGELAIPSAADTRSAVTTRGLDRATRDADDAAGIVGTPCISAADASTAVAARSRYRAAADGDVAAGVAGLICISAADTRTPSSTGGRDGTTLDDDVAATDIFSTTNARTADGSKAGSR